MTCTADAGSPAAGLRDLATHTDIEVLLRRFYDQAFRDEVLAPPFAELAARGLEQHLPVMCDFWETVLFRAGLYRRNALTVHRRIHESTPLSPRHFARWLALWTATVDQMYQGPVADRAKIQAGRIAAAMNRRLTGVDDPGGDTDPSEPQSRRSNACRSRP